MSQEINRKIIFFDIDLFTSPTETNMQNNPDIIQKYFTKYCISTNAPKHLQSLSCDEVLLLVQWNDNLANNYQSDEKEYIQLYEMLTAMGITVKGCTPLSNKSRSTARPFEIRDWLNRFPLIFSYVILDDDTFWGWGYLQRNIVTTKPLYKEKLHLFQKVLLLQSI